MSDESLQTELWTVREFALYMRISLGAARNMIWRGEIPRETVVRIGRRMRLKAAAIREWVEAKADPQKLSAFIDGLQELPRQEAWFWAPESFGGARVEHHGVGADRSRTGAQRRQRTPRVPIAALGQQAFCVQRGGHGACGG